MSVAHGTKPTTGATPLAALEAVAIDTETTGLDPLAARIVQIGALIVRAGAIERDANLDRLVNPGIAIPAPATRIHGIDDLAVAKAPGFELMWPDFRRFCGGRVVIGHSIGFDLAVLQYEATRNRLAFDRPRSLCVRLLASVANPALPDYSLEMIASWLGLDIAGRHTALGDATAAAEIFLALLPRLAERGVRTLAEAERASLGLTGELERQYRAGWSEPVSQPILPAYGAIDPFAYRHRVADVMAAPPVVMRDDAAASAVIARMAELRISSVLVSSDASADGPVEAYGIVTERDMMRRLAAQGAAALDAPVGRFATRPLKSIRAAAFVYRAIGRMDRLKIRHLAVRDEAGQLVGMVTARDLLRLRAGAAIRLDDAIEAARSTAEIAAAWATLPAVARGLIGETVDPLMIAEVISDELCSMTRRAALLAEVEMRDAGAGEPPCPYALLVLGSGGRGESLLAADQDNAIVFAEGEPDGLEDRWFARLGERIAAILDQAGVPYCKGGVMAKNAGFRGSVATWQARIDEWVRRSRPQDLLNVDIFFDLRAVHGELGIGHALREYAFARAAGAADFAKLLGQTLDTLANPFALFGGLQLDAGRLDLKMHGLFPIVATARTLAIRHGIAERSTRARLDALIARDIGGDEDLRTMREGHAFLIGLMLDQQSADLHVGVPVSNRVETGRLARADLTRLKSLLRSLQSAPTLVRDLMFG
jgi:CBS domain-containing protein